MKKVIIIGGTSGIGRTMANQYLSKGYSVGISGRTEAALAEFVQEPSAQGRAFATTFDVRSPDRRQYLRQLIDQMGGMDIFIYCSGVGKPSRTLNEETELETFETNVTGFIDLTLMAYHYFASSGKAGTIVGISSIASNRGLQSTPAYSAGKAFMSNYLEGLWFKAKKSALPIAVVDIQPGYVATKMAQGNLFWVVPVDKAARQITEAIEKKRKRAYISKRWALVAWMLRNAPQGLIARFT